MNNSPYLSTIESTLQTILTNAIDRPKELADAMRWAVEGGGKRIRPQICLAACTAVGGNWQDAIYPACAIELLHSYTLIHDDLPAMDNDILRRGKPTVWKQFGEANAILAGDALQALAFKIASQAPRNVNHVIQTLAQAAIGVVAGQVEDIATELLPHTPTILSTSSRITERRNALDFIYKHKTGDLFQAAATMGALTGDTTPNQKYVSALSTYGAQLGLAFQFEDDLLDGDSPYSPEETRRRAEIATQAALSALEDLPGDCTFLQNLAQKLLNRSY